MRAGYGALREEGVGGSEASLASPQASGSTEQLRAAERAREDLYQWMAKQDPIKVVSMHFSPLPLRFVHSQIVPKLM